MCGIFFSTLGPKTNGEFTRTVRNLIKHRGTCAPVIHQDGNFIFALSLLPVQGSSPVSQPVVNGRQVLIFAGELWQQDGEKSDTKYLFELLSRSNDISKTLRALRGMFAVVFKDEDTIYFASDVFGEVPLYFWHANDNLCVGSEIKQMVSLGASLKQI